MENQCTSETKEKTREGGEEEEEEKRKKNPAAVEVRRNAMPTE